MRGKVLEFINYFVSEGVNMWNDRVSFLQLGSSLHCNICGYYGRFVHKSNRLGISWNSICPKCDSRSRHRGLYILYQKLIPKDKSILHFAPEPILSRLFSHSNLYKTTDYLLEDVDYKGEDIQKLTISSETFDWVLCNHVIEHVSDDGKAFSEINRILKKDGCAIITLPGDYNRKNTVFFKDLSLNGHFRDYGWDVLDKLCLYFSEVNPVDLSSIATTEKVAIKVKDYAFVCKKRIELA